MWPSTMVASGTRTAACSTSSGVVIGSSPQWKSVGAPKFRGAADEGERPVVGGVGDRRDRMELQPRETKVADGVHEQPLCLIPVPRVDPRVGVEASGVGGHNRGDHLERVGVDLPGHR